MEILTGVSLAPYTTLKVGGAAQYLAVVKTIEDLDKVRQYAQHNTARMVLLGSGSNVLISDQGFDGLVLINQITGVTYESISGSTIHVTIGAGELLDDVVADTVSRGYWGFENLSHIPGTVGAAPVQNVGAYGVELASLVHHVDAYNLKTGEQAQFANLRCAFGYRDSFFKTDAGRNWCITGVTCVLTTDRRPQLQYGDLNQLNSDTCTQDDIRAKVIEIRQGKFPDWKQVGTAGSFFKNPIISANQRDQLLQQYPALPTFVMPDGRYKVALGWVLDKVCGLRGYTDGPVSLYENQALVLVNTGNSAAAIQAFAQEVARRVYQATTITIEPEVSLVQ